MSFAFAELAREHGLLSVLEPVVRGPAGFDREAAIVEAAAELSRSGCDLYKCQVPLEGKGDPAEITRWSREIDAATCCPWVVLSQGVDPADFPAAVEAALQGRRLRDARRAGGLDGRPARRGSDRAPARALGPATSGARRDRRRPRAAVAREGSRMSTDTDVAFYREHGYLLCRERLRRS